MPRKHHGDGKKSPQNSFASGTKSLISQGTGRANDANMFQLRNILTQHLSDETTRKHSNLPKYLKCRPEASIRDILNLADDISSSVENQEASALISKRLAKKLLVRSSGVAHRGIMTAYADGCTPRISMVLAYLEHALDNNGSYAKVELGELFATMGLDTNPRMHDTLILSTGTNYSMAEHTLSQLFLELMRQEHTLYKQDLVSNPATNDNFRARVRMIYWIMHQPDTASIYEAYSDYVRVHRSMVVSQNNIRETQDAIELIAQNKAVFMPAGVRAYTNWFESDYKGDYTGRVSDPDRFDNLSSKSFLVTPDNLRAVHNSFKYCHDESATRGQDPRKFINDQGELSYEHLPYTAECLGLYCEDRKAYPDMQAYIALSTASISMMLSNCKKDSDDYELLRAIIMMSKDLLRRTFDLLQAEVKDVTAQNVGPSKPYLHNSEVKQALRIPFPYLSASILQTCAPNEQMSNGWELVVPGMKWFKDHQALLQEEALSKAVATQCVKEHKRRLAQLEPRKQDGPNVVTALLNQVAKQTDGFKPMEQGEKRKLSRGMKSWVEQWNSGGSGKPPKLQKGMINSLHRAFLKPGKVPRKATTNATRHKPELKKGGKGSEPPLTPCKICKQEDKPYHWTKECPERDMSQIECYGCKKKGHYKSDCPFTDKKLSKKAKKKVNKLKAEKAKAKALEAESEEELTSSGEEEEEETGSGDDGLSDQ